jgi:hypothetical protein
MRVLRFAGIASLVLALSAAAAEWSPSLFRDANTLEYYTVNPEGEGHWSTVWVVVIDEVPYLRLGSRAAARIALRQAQGERESASIVKIRIGGDTFDGVRAEAAPEMAGKVAAAMGEKYWTDLVIRYFPHPLTVRLVPEK